MKQSIIIIGAGIGGLATAARLIKKGYDVRIIEKNLYCGGKIGAIKQAGFTFDLTASIMLMPNYYRELAEELELDLNFIKLEPNYRVHYSDDTKLDFYTDLTQTLEQIENVSNKDGLGYLKFLTDGYQKYQNTLVNFLSKNFDYRDDLLNSKTLNGILRSSPLTDSYHYISKYIKDERLRNFFTFQAMYIGVNPYKSSNLYCLIPIISALKGLWYLKGGLNSFVLALEKYIITHGGRIDFNTTCKQITYQESHVTGVVTDKGTICSNMVICNSDYSYSMNTYFHDLCKEKKRIIDKGRKFDYSCSVFMLYLGLQKKYETLQVHNIYIGENFKKNIEAAFKGRLPYQPSLYIYCPSKVDFTMAPAGKDAINVMVRVPNTLKSNIIWDELQIKRMRNILIQSLQKIKGLEDINKNIEFEKYLTPNNLEEQFNCCYGSAFGISHNLAQTAFLRPQIKSNDFENLFFIGDSIHPGAGASLVLLGSELICQYF